MSREEADEALGVKNMLKRLEKQAVRLASPPTCRAGRAGESSLSQSHALGVAQRTQKVTHEETGRKLSLSCSTGGGEEGIQSQGLDIGLCLGSTPCF